MYMKKPHEMSKFSKIAILGITGMMIAGTCTMISSKLALQTQACPIYIKEEYWPIPEWKHQKCPKYLLKKFEKPWFQTALLFAATTFCGLVYFSFELIKKLTGKKVNSYPWQVYLWLFVSSLCGVAMLTLLTYGMMFVDVSISQMVRASMVIFCSLFNVVLLKRKLLKVQWVSIFSTAIAIIIVGMSSLLSSSFQKPW